MCPLLNPLDAMGTYLLKQAEIHVNAYIIAIYSLMDLWRLWAYIHVYARGLLRVKRFLIRHIPP